LHLAREVGASLAEFLNEPFLEESDSSWRLSLTMDVLEYLNHKRIVVELDGIEAVITPLKLAAT